MPLIGSIVPIRNKLIYPAGIMPNFDATHPASANCYVSAAVIAACYGEFAKGARATRAGSPSSSIFSWGPALTFAVNTGYTYPIPATAPTSTTLAAIIYSTSFPSTGNVCQVGTTSNFQCLNLATGGALRATYGSTNFTSSITLSLNTPYFVVWSASNLQPINFVVTNLKTGQIFSSTVANSNSATTPNSIFGAPLSNGGFTGTGSIAALAYSGTLLSLNQLLAWAADPWAFWYPQRPPSWKGTKAAAPSAFLAAWAMNKNRIDRIVP